MHWNRLTGRAHPSSSQKAETQGIIQGIGELVALSHDKDASQEAWKAITLLLPALIEYVMNMKIADPAKASLERSIDDLLTILEKVVADEESKTGDPKQSDDSHPDGLASEETENTSRWLKTFDRIVDNLKDALDVAKDADISVPGIAIAITLLSKLVEKAQDARTNSRTKKSFLRSIRDFEHLLEESAREIQSETSGLRSAASVQGDQRLTNIIIKLLCDLQKLRRRAEELFKKHTFTKYIDSSSDREALDDMQKDVDALKQNLKTRLEFIRTHALTQVVDLIKKQVDRQLTADQEAILNKLRFVDASWRSANAGKSRLLPGTREKLLQDLTAWAQDSSRGARVFVIHGPAGMGKSTIAYEFAKRMEGGGLLGASFFFQRGSEERSDLHRVIPTLVWQLAHSQPEPLRGYLIKAVKDHLDHGFDQLTDHQLQDLLKIPLSNVPSQQGPVVMILDAVDESSEHHRELVPVMLEQLLGSMSNMTFPLRVLITTRPEHDIHATLSLTTYKTITSTCKLRDLDPHHHDIRFFIEAELKKLPEGRVRELLDARRHAVKLLTQKAGGLFLFATIAMTYLRKHDRNVVAAFDELVHAEPAVEMYVPLDKIYLTVLGDAQKELQGTAWRAHIGTVLGCIALSREYLTPKIMHGLLGTPTDGILSVVDHMSSILMTPFDVLDEDSEIRPLHTSFTQFLVDPTRCRNEEFLVDMRAFHGRLAAGSLAMMTALDDGSVLRQNLVPRKDPAMVIMKQDVHNLKTLVEQTIPKDTRYSCLFWASHICETRSTEGSIRALKGFLTSKLLIWFELLSYMDRLDVAVQALMKVREWCEMEKVSDEDTSVLVHDARRFILEYFDVINHCPEHMYISVLPMMPESTLLKYYPSTSPRAVRMLTPRPAGWGSCVRVIAQDDGIADLKYSPDGRWIISVASSVRFWDAASGVLLFEMPPPRMDQLPVQSAGPLHGENPSARPINAFAISGDSRRIVFARVFELKLSLWDVAARVQLHEFKGDSGDEAEEYLRVTFTRDDKQIVALTGRRFRPQFPGEPIFALSHLRVWDVDRGTAVQEHALRIQSPNTQRVISSALSRDGLSLVSIQEDIHTRDVVLQVWNLGSEQPIATLPVLPEARKPFCALFHPKRHDQVVFACGGLLPPAILPQCCVGLWEYKSGKVVFFEGNTGHIFRRLAISPTGDTVATFLGKPQTPQDMMNVEDQIMRLWDAGSRIPLANLKVSGTVTALVAFSPDGRQLASVHQIAQGHQSRHIRVWDVTKEGISAHIRDAFAVVQVAFSSDGSLIALGHRDGTMNIWQTISGKKLRTLTIKSYSDLHGDYSIPVSVAFVHHDCQVLCICLSKLQGPRKWKLAKLDLENSEETATSPRYPLDLPPIDGRFSKDGGSLMMIVPDDFQSSSILVLKWIIEDRPDGPHLVDEGPTQLGRFFPDALNPSLLTRFYFSNDCRKLYLVRFRSRMLQIDSLPLDQPSYQFAPVDEDTMPPEDLDATMRYVYDRETSALCWARPFNSYPRRLLWLTLSAHQDSGDPLLQAYGHHVVICSASGHFAILDLKNYPEFISEATSGTEQLPLWYHAPQEAGPEQGSRHSGEDGCSQQSSV
ncbi:hypothetical protein OBBRIDRAFT_827101 [Obba rivulosa]|uniref:NACHT domain-containing protein n=1 Tax=Obba rivulosa TaxID=1052685 RepID=A0A8E2AQH0_9APHY|nr:hypothetical protein OBBRIDRAFT_827101 [Obba rivulosa]